MACVFWLVPRLFVRSEYKRGGRIVLDDFALRESRAGGSGEEICVSRAEGAHLGDGVFFSVPGPFNCGVDEGVSKEEWL